MFKYRCPACGATAYSSASYSTLGECPSCGQSLREEESVRVPEPAPISAETRCTAAPSAASSAERSPPQSA